MIRKCSVSTPIRSTSRSHSVSRPVCKSDFLKLMINKMKLKHIIFIAGLITLVASACKKESFLNRTPLSDISPQTFFTNETDLQLYCTQYYKSLPVQTLLRSDDQSDDKAHRTLNTLLAGT